LATAEDLLARHQPVLKYDSQESYFADSAAEWTDNPGNTLSGGDGKAISSAGHGLSLAFLGQNYGNGRAATNKDKIGDPGTNYADQARRLHVLPGYANRIYGHAVLDAADDLWLQYWFWYFYNDFNLIGNIIKAGLHEGDWEMIQIRLRDEQPDLAVFAQHAHAESRDWSQVDVVPGTERPLVYVARGSHASYFEPGTHWTGAWFDHADGKRKSPDQTLEIISDGAPAWNWVRWPGSWGDTRASGDNPLDSNSPRSPGGHAQFDDPLSLVETAARAAAAAPTPSARPLPPPAPRVRVEWAAAGIRVYYRVLAAAGSKRPTGVTVTLNSPDEAAPPITRAFRIANATGSVELDGAIDPTRRYDIYVSAATADGLASESVRADLSPESRPGA
jgi:hypothetical protein